MIQYRAPLRDIEFALFEVLDYKRHLASLGGVTEIDLSDARAIFAGASRFAEQQLLPLNQSGDAEGCQLVEGDVRTPTGFKAAYCQYQEGGWTGLAEPTVWGGAGLPASMAIAVTELFATANWSWSMYPGLAPGAIATLKAHGTPRQMAHYLPRLVSGQWTATMCLTEPQGGSDLSLVRLRAEPAEDGHYRLTGNKMFITAGDHDLADNIVHIVLARLPNAPPGTRGLSLFLVPKYLSNEEGNLTTRNGVRCGGLEDKMGLKASATCALYFEDAYAELLGEPHHGLECMFIFMNAARIGAGQQGVVHAELGYQNALAYARERRAMRAPHGGAGPDPIILHPDVRRMLLQQRAIAEGGRLLILEAAVLLDSTEFGVDAAAAMNAQYRLAFLTPVIKGFLTELGIEAANLALQCLGGHGYLRDWGLEQNLRDARVATLYEGTTGIQAIDLLGRKVVRDGGKAVAQEAELLMASCDRAMTHPDLETMARALRHETDQWTVLTKRIMRDAASDPLLVAAAATDYLMYVGYLLLGHSWLRAAITASEAKYEGSADNHHDSKLTTAHFYFARLFPRTAAHRAILLAGSSALAAEADPYLTGTDGEPGVAMTTVQKASVGST